MVDVCERREDLGFKSEAMECLEGVVVDCVDKEDDVDVDDKE